MPHARALNTRCLWRVSRMDPSRETGRGLRVAGHGVGGNGFCLPAGAECLYGVTGKLNDL